MSKEQILEILVMAGLYDARFKEILKAWEEWNELEKYLEMLEKENIQCQERLLGSVLARFY